jgi:hypothetical protein
MAQIALAAATFVAMCALTVSAFSETARDYRPIAAPATAAAAPVVVYKDAN